jgi:hypothetical protein
VGLVVFRPVLGETKIGQLGFEILQNKIHNHKKSRR